MTDQDVAEQRRRCALAYVAARSRGAPLDSAYRITLNFHPDRMLDRRPILWRMAEDGIYRSQFVTATSNGGLTAYPGGDRWRWESRIFGGAYDDAPPDQRPVYGAVNFRRRRQGAAPRFGSAHFRLTVDVLERATFCFPDSATEPEAFGVASSCDLVERAEDAEADPLDDYVEAQVHGPVRLEHDVAALVLDPCYRGTAVERAARRLPCRLEWHQGYRLSIERLRPYADYRGPGIVRLAERVAVGGVLDPRVIGDAARGGQHDPQDLKKVWHCLARFGDRETVG